MSRLMTRARIGPRSLRWAAAAVAVVVLAGGGTAYAVTRGEPAGNYRTVAATIGDVEETLAGSGTVDAAQRADLRWGTGGTVARVLVHEGQRVTAGQVVARLDPTDLDAAVTKAQADLARARAQLASDEAAQSAAVEAAAASTSPSSSPSTSSVRSSSARSASGPSGTSGTSSALATLATEQRAVLEAQRVATTAMRAAREALAAQQQACAKSDQPEADQPEGDQPADDQSTDETGSTAAAADDACAVALAAVQDKQAAVATAQDALAKALDALAATLTKALAALEAAGQHPQQPQGQQHPEQQSQQPQQQSSHGPTGQTVTAAQLASDEAAIDQANADLVTARQARAQATLRATRDGTVAAVDVARGDRVSAGDTAMTLFGGRAVTVTVPVSEDHVGEVKPGQRVRVHAPGSTRSVTGTVTAVGLVADSSSGTTTYPVTVTVEDPAIALPTGSRAQVEIVTGTVAHAVTVPISAVSRRGDRATVMVPHGDVLRPRTVTVAAAGGNRVAISKGLAAGERVVLADLDQPITGASTSLNQRRFGGPAGPAVRVERGPGGATTFTVE